MTLATSYIYIKQLINNNKKPHNSMSLLNGVAFFLSCVTLRIEMRRQYWKTIAPYSNKHCKIHNSILSKQDASQITQLGVETSHYHDQPATFLK